MTHTYSYACLPDNMEDAIGHILILNPENNDTDAIKVYGKADKYVFALAHEKPYHRKPDDRIRLFAKEEIYSEDPRIHALAVTMGYAAIKKLFVSIGTTDISHLNDKL